MNKNESLQQLDDWHVVCQVLPPGWEKAARRLGAFRRTRGIPDAGALLRVLMIHLADGCSLKESALRARQAGWCAISAVALFRRLQAAEQSLRWLAEQLWHGAPAIIAKSGYRVRAVDATTIEGPGSTGTEWRVHYGINLADLQCGSCELTTAEEGETFRRIPVCRGDLLLGDPVYANPPGIGHVARRGDSVLVRVNPRSLSLYDARGRRIPLLSRLKALRMGEVAGWSAWVHVRRRRIAGRLIAIKPGRQAARRARARLHRRARRNSKRGSKEALFLAGYLLVWTTIPSDALNSAEVLEIYRVRWLIEKDQADYTSSDWWCEPTSTGYDRCRCAA